MTVRYKHTNNNKEKGTFLKTVKSNICFKVITKLVYRKLHYIHTFLFN